MVDKGLAAVAFTAFTSWMACCPTLADSRAPALTASVLAEFCQSRDEAIHNGCRFFILGVFEAAGVAGQIQGHKICIPDNLSSSAMEIAVRETMGRDFEFYPNDKKEPAISVVMAAIVDKFPCKVRPRSVGRTP